MSDGRMIFEREREDLARIIKLIFERKNTNVAGGNFSFKVIDDAGKEYIIMTPTMMSEAYLGNVSASQVLVVEPHTRKIIDGVGNLTREINLHEAMYDTNPDIKAVLHAHAPNAMFWATSGLDLPNLTEATQKVEYVPVLEFEPNCSEELAELVSNYIKKEDLKIPHMLLLNSHGVLINTTGSTGLEAIHKALSILDTMEWNADIAYKQTIFQKMGLLDGYYSKGVKVGDLDDLKNHVPIFNQKIADAGGD
ncbi:MAG: class II aldolase/adducin family protein [Vagococcus fluvialis]|uniref:class II aldolase/adducin family protein n=1 Tax=Vagococcus fluvialis TaxID=2738 RepID=UPI000A3525E3|nr:class II aldolase/adducin family protein [Vagococcus fluvialis]MBO0419424.1 class II aldolase/adducin family protein [Vagococcus fluvialis]OTP33311.1 class II aldolase and adducin protein [Enterococcus sp. 6C8_DIV0013]